MNGLVELRHLPRQCQKKGKGVLGYAHGIPAGRAHHQDAAFGGGFEVNIVHAHAGAPHRAQLGRKLQ